MNDIQRFNKLIKGIQFCMMTTVSNVDESLRSRPMTLQKSEFEGDLWFFAGRSTPPVLDLEENPKVNLAFANPKDTAFVSATGIGEAVFDKEKTKELWNPIYQAWFPKGVDDPELCLIRVVVEGADYWDAPSSAMVQMLGFAKAILTGKKARGLAEHGHIS
jgi:general stress protein 26